MSESRELPYDFDLLWDVKTMEQVERIANYEGDCSEATPEDLVVLFGQCDLPVPECLESFTPIIELWVLPDGEWVDKEPLDCNARKVRIKG